MKKVYWLAVLFVLFGCQQKQKIAQLEEQKAQLESEYNLLVEESAMKDKFIAEYTETVNEVYSNLERIRKRENLLLRISKDMPESDSASMKQKMLTNIASIDRYIQKSKKRLRALRAKSAKWESQKAALQETIENLQKIIAQKEKDLAAMRAQVEHLNARVAEVEEELENKTEFIKVQEQQLRTGFYIIGTEEELKQKGIIVERGGFLGIHKTKTLAADFSTKDFLTTDITHTEVIPIAGSPKKVELISPHKDGTYNLLQTEENQTVLKITNPEEFWKIRYLVILTRG